MNFSILGVEIDLKRKRKGKVLDLDGLKVINNSTLEYIRSLSKEELIKRNESASVFSLNDSSEVNRKLDDFGIVIVPDFLARDVIDKTANVINEFEVELKKFLDSGDTILETKSILFQLGAEKLKGYSALSNYPKTVVFVRQGQDEGMVDVFNIDYAFNELKTELRKCYDESDILNVISSDTESLKFKNLNFYINRQVASTRGFHADSYERQLKAFIYLTDCLTLDDGPYTYVKESHKDSPYRAANKFISETLPNKTECPLVDHQKIIPVLGKAGSLVISDQSGFHRGFPQSQGHSRVVSVMNVTSQ